NYRHHEVVNGIASERGDYDHGHHKAANDVTPKHEDYDCGTSRSHERHSS
ncbi:hypothetical protein A2U01_0059851, partial [Trifolium medium]|nr:hypothetical protein [Trifolium medium]